MLFGILSIVLIVLLLCAFARRTLASLNSEPTADTPRQKSKMRFAELRPGPGPTRDHALWQYAFHNGSSREAGVVPGVNEEPRAQFGGRSHETPRAALSQTCHF